MSLVDLGVRVFRSIEQTNESAVRDVADVPDLSWGAEAIRVAPLGRLGVPQRITVTDHGEVTGVDIPSLQIVHWHSETTIAE